MNPQYQQPGAGQTRDPNTIPGLGAAPAAQAPLANPVKTNPNSTQNALLISEI